MAAMSPHTRRVKLRERLEAVRLRSLGEKKEGRRCAHPGCGREGAYPAPRSRERLRDFIWFCLEHVREYNQKWDYFAGMSAAEIDAHRFADFTWHRPTWRFGTGPGYDPGRMRVEDPLGLFGNRSRRRRANGSYGRLEEMMARMGLAPGYTEAELKRRYKELVKRYHPDLNGGDKRLEERLKSINEAYTYLSAHLAFRSRR